MPRAQPRGGQIVDKSGFNIPWASIAVLVAFVSSVLLPPRAFEALRPAEKDAAQSAHVTELEVEARLWEDPFTAMRRHELERVARCDKLKPEHKPRVADCAEATLEARRAPSSLWTSLDRDDDKDRSDTLVVAALVPGHAFVGAEESRRRTRYALLAGFHAKDYVPDNAGRIGIVRFDWSSQGADKPADLFLDVPYELLSQRPMLRGETEKSERRYARIALLWIDESALPAPKLDNLARTIGRLFDDGAGAKAPQLTVIGPSSSDALRLALTELVRATQDARDNKLPPTVRAGYGHLARAEILSPWATASTAQFELLKGQKLEDFVTDRLQDIAASPNLPAGLVRRTIAPDNQVLRSLVKELNLRLPEGADRRVVLVAERDSLYAQGLVTELKYRMRDATKLEFEARYFFRGIDGVTTRASAEKAASDKAGRADAAIEWPESRDQLDYLRRMAASLKASEDVVDGRPIGAIGIIGFDVHDKLLVLQALHETFSDKVFFTTDMDARYLHPRTLAFTRNLIVASSLPLEFEASLQAGVPPLRDVYQAAAYLAARRAACRGGGCKTKEDLQANAVLDAPSVYEIGRSRAVAVAGYGHQRLNGSSNVSRSTVAATGLILLVFALLVWPSTPALKLAGIAVQRQRECEARGPPTPLTCASASPQALRAVALPIAMLVALHMALLAFSVGSAIEFVRAGSLGVGGVMSLATLVGITALFACYPRGDGQEPAQRRWCGWIALAAVAAVLGWMAWSARSQSSCVDCEPVAWLEGVSAWPSHLIRLLALFGIAYSFDMLWRHALASMDDDSTWLALPLGHKGGLRRDSWRRGVWAWFLCNTLAGWRRPGCGSVEFAGLWRQYLRRGRPAARVIRVLTWYAVTVAVIGVLFVAFSDGYVPEIPVRGADQRRLVAWTLYAALLLLPLLIVAVADATMLACRFVWHLNRARSRYPCDTVQRFAQALGPAHQEVWIAPIAADPAHRALAGPLQRGDEHSLLDDWIDVQVVARRTRAVAPLVIGPFCVLALLVVAHSRLFDNWAVTLPAVLAAGGYLAWLILLSALLKLAAERTRKSALERMNADLRWLAGVNEGKLVAAFERLIKAVENNHSGAFAPLFEQPFVRALLVPLGGAGGVQLFDRFLLGR